MRAIWRPVSGVLMSGLVACGGSIGAVTGEPLSEVARTVESPVRATTTTSRPQPVPSSDHVVSEFDRLMTIRVECGRRPRACRVDDVAAVGSSMHDELSSLMDARTRAGIVASGRGALRYRVDGARVDGDVASITTCLYDDVVLTMDGSIFDESTMSAITEWTMVRTAQGWRWSDWRAITSTREGDLCGFAG